MRVAYFTNQYPKVSHTFIRREIQALERQGVQIARVALRGWSDPLVDPDDLAERRLTHYLLKRGLASLLGATLRRFLAEPRLFLRAFAASMRMSRQSDRVVPYHWVYLAEACALLEWCSDRGIDHLHAHFGTNPAEVALLTHTLGGPRFSFTVHGPEEFDRPVGLHLREKIAGASQVIAISSFARSQLFRWIPFSDWPKVQVVHCGLEPAFSVLPPNPSFTSAPRLVCVGRLCEQKGQLLLVEAVRRLRDRGEPVELVLAGDGELRQDIEDLIRQHRLPEQITITGWVSSEAVKAQLLAARALVLGSFAEGLPVVIMEAMALGRPVVSTSIAGIPELVRAGQDGWLVPAGDVEALTEAMSEALRAPIERLQAMGAAARERVLARHDIDREAEKLARHFREAT